MWRAAVWREEGAHLERGDLVEDGLGDGLELVEDRPRQEGARVLVAVLTKHDQHVTCGGATVRGTYGTPKADTCTSYKQ